MQETKTQTTTPDNNGNNNPRVWSGYQTRLHTAPQVLVIPNQTSSLTILDWVDLMLAHLVSKEVVLVLLLLPGGRRMILKGDGVVSHRRVVSRALGAFSQGLLASLLPAGEPCAKVTKNDTKAQFGREITCNTSQRHWYRIA
jgi:hypothetical protein